MGKGELFWMDHNGKMILTPGLPGMLSICIAAGNPIWFGLTVGIQNVKQKKSLVQYLEQKLKKNM